MREGHRGGRLFERGVGGDGLGLRFERTEGPEPDSLTLALASELEEKLPGSEVLLLDAVARRYFENGGGPPLAPASVPALLLPGEAFYAEYALPKGVSRTLSRLGKRPCAGRGPSQTVGSREDPWASLEPLWAPWRRVGVACLAPAPGSGHPLSPVLEDNGAPVAGFERLLHAVVYGIHDEDHGPRGPFLRWMLPLGEAAQPLTAGLVCHPRGPDGPLGELWEPVAGRLAEALLGPVVLGLGLGRCRNGDLEPLPPGPTSLAYLRPRVRPVRVEAGGREIRSTGQPSGSRIARGEFWSAGGLWWARVGKRRRG